ncbi:chemocyanin-like [Salvia divinorum]|uniref:Chemocyanin-like n=1 Tax=Salvia divinorum TaxID=28513 RepID=A0ABD1I6F5_SALDI
MLLLPKSIVRMVLVSFYKDHNKSFKFASWQMWNESMIHLLFLDFGVSEVYRVGDESGWNSGIGTNFAYKHLSWSQKYNFTVGGILVFKYSKAQHNVKQVTDATYSSCNASNGVMAVYESGNDKIRLTDAKKYNSICDKDSYCIGGMRFSTTVLEASTSNNTTPCPRLRVLPSQ